MANTTENNPIRETIKDELDASSQLLTLLKQENEALSINDIEAVHSLSEMKNQLIEKIQYLDEQRQNLVKQAGFNADKEGIDQYLCQCESNDRPVLHQQWQNLLEVAEKCHHQNSINGQIIFSNLHFTKRALSILRGQNEENSLRYGPDGETINTGKTSTLAIA